MRERFIVEIACCKAVASHRSLQHVPCVCVFIGAYPCWHRWRARRVALNSEGSHGGHGRINIYIYIYIYIPFFLRSKARGAETLPSSVCVVCVMYHRMHNKVNPFNPFFVGCFRLNKQTSPSN